LLVGCFLSRIPSATMTSLTTTNVVWTYIGRTNAAGVSCSIEIWWGKVNASPGTTVTATWDSGTSFYSHVSEWSGTDLVTPVDAAIQANSGNSTTASTATYTSLDASDVIIAMAGSQNSTAPGAPTGSFTSLRSGGTGTGAAARAFAAAYRIPGATGNYSTTWTVGSSNWRTLIVGLKGAAPTLTNPFNPMVGPLGQHGQIVG
jgi:hypothetical protein